MATEGEKSGRESGKTKGETGNASRTPATRSGSSSAEGEGASKGKAGVSEYQKTRQRELEAVLAKRTEANPDAPAIVREFAMLWLPHHLVEAEMLAPALQDAGVDEDKMAAVKVRKDILNLLLADLIQTAEVEFAEAKLEALSDAFDAVVRASDREGEELTEPMESGEGMSALGSQMKARYARVKERFANFDQTIGEAMDMLAPRSLSVSSTRRQNRRENSMARYSRAVSQRNESQGIPESGLFMIHVLRRVKEAAGMALSEDLRTRVVEAVVVGGLSRNAAAKRFGVSIASAVRWLQRFQATGEISPAPTGGDRRSDRIEAHREYLLGLIRRQPDITLLEIQERLIANCGERFSLSVIWRFFDRHEITFKKKPRMQRNSSAPTS